MKKTAVVTGGSRGIGFSIAKQLGEDGFNVAIVDVNDRKDYEDNLKQLDEAGIDYLYIKGDICNAADRERAVEETVGKYGGIHALVNNAGVAANGDDLLEVSEEEFDRVVGINTKGTLLFTQNVAKQMIKQPYEGKKRGTIVNVSSGSGWVSTPEIGVYCVSKAGVSMLTTLFADRLASEGILVNEVRPILIATAMALDCYDEMNQMVEDGLFPIARWGQPEDVAQAVSAFCSDKKFLYSTGNFVNIDGGYQIPRMK